MDILKIEINKKRVFLGSISLLVIFFFIQKIEIRELFNIIISFKWENAIISLFLYLVNYLIRLKRLMIVFNGNNWLRWFQFIGIFQLINRTLPFRSGEVVFPILLKRMFNIKYIESISKLITVRLFDVLTLLLVFLATVSWIGFGKQIYILLIILLIFLLFTLLFYNKKGIIGFIYNIYIKMFSHHNEKLAIRIKSNMIEALKIDRFQLFSLFVLSIFDKIINFGCIVIIVYGLGFNIILDKLLVAIGLSGFSEILPINSLGNFGSLELGWVGALVYLGIDIETGIQSGFAFHLVIYSFGLIIGLLCMIIFSLNKLKVCR